MFKYTVNMDTFSRRIQQNPPLDRRITAEQILHLYRMLAEQAENKNQINKNRGKEIQSEDISSSRCSEHEFYERLSADSDDQPDQRAVMLEDSNAVYLSVPMTKTKQVNKDILNKIRNQIFERKRQKLANIQRSAGVVWRPW